MSFFLIDSMGRVPSDWYHVLSGPFDHLPLWKMWLQNCYHLRSSHLHRRTATLLNSYHSFSFLFHLWPDVWDWDKPLLLSHHYSSLQILQKAHSSRERPGNGRKWSWDIGNGTQCAGVISSFRRGGHVSHCGGNIHPGVIMRSNVSPGSNQVLAAPRQS